MTLHVGLIGCGSITQPHVEGWAALGERAKIVAIADISQENAAARASQIGHPVEVYQNYHDLLADPALDAVDIARRVLCRMFSPRGQLLLYKVLYEAGETGVPYYELPERMGIRTDQISGVMGALGTRINYTEGLKSQRPGTAFL